MSRLTALGLALAAAVGGTTCAWAVSLNPDGFGQALIFPYYTVRSVNGNAFNTFVSVVNHTDDVKAVRVRFLEGRNARVAQSFNLYLSPKDAWTGAVVPEGSEGARIITTDTSCTNVAFDNAVPRGLSFQNAFYAGSNTDGFAAGLDRTREGYVEMIEMATLTGASAAAVSHMASGVPANCGAIASEGAVQATAPTGRLSGTLTLINVANGSDFTVNAEALSELSAQPFFRPSADPYPGFDAAEVTAASVVTANGKIYRSLWPRGIDAVSAVLMRRDLLTEFVLDEPTRSRTDIVTAFPTRKHYGTGSANVAPFDATGVDNFSFVYFNRDERASTAPSCGPFECPSRGWESPVSVVTLSNGSAHTASASGVLGSLRGPRYSGIGAPAQGTPLAMTGFVNGWLRLAPIASPLTPHTLTSLPGSTRIDAASGTLTGGPHVFTGLPMVGFMLRTFENGTLACGAGSCQGNYGGAFPLKYRREITP